MPEIMNVGQAAKYLGTGTDLLYALAQRDDIPHFHVGRYLRFRRDEIDEWTRGHEHQRLTCLKKAR